MLKKLLLATTNIHKIQEFNSIFVATTSRPVLALCWIQTLGIKLVTSNTIIATTVISQEIRTNVDKNMINITIYEINSIGFKIPATEADDSLATTSEKSPIGKESW